MSRPYVHQNKTPGTRRLHPQFPGMSNSLVHRVQHPGPSKQVNRKQTPKKAVEHYILNEWGRTSSELAELRSLQDPDDNEEEDM